MIPNISIVEQYTRIENFHCFSNISFANNNYNSINAIHTEQDLHTYTYLSNEITDYNNTNPSFLGICNNHYTIQSLSSTNDFKPLTALELENYFRNENNNVSLSSSSSLSSNNNNNNNIKALAVFIRQNTFYLFFNNNRLISINTGLSINYSNILQNGEIIIDIYPYEGPLLTLTNFGRVMYLSTKREDENNQNINYFVTEFMEDENEPLIIRKWGKVLFGLTFIYFINNKDGLLYKLDKGTLFPEIKRIIDVKYRLKEIKILHKKGICLFKTLVGNRWIVYNKSITETFPFFEKCNYNELNIQLILKKNIKDKQILTSYNENLQCIDILGNGTEIIGFLMEDYNIYFSELKINKKKVIFEFKVFNLKDLNNSIFNDNKLIDYTFHNITMNCYIYQYGLQKLMNVLIYFERKYFITKENVNFTNQLLLKTNDYNTSDISFSFLK